MPFSKQDGTKADQSPEIQLICANTVSKVKLRKGGAARVDDR